MRQPVIEYTIQFCMHTPMYTHVHTTLPPHTNSCEPDRQRVPSATSNESDKKQDGDCDSKKHNNAVLKNAMLWGAKEDIP